MPTMPSEIEQLCSEHGAARETLQVGDNIVEFGWSLNRGHYLIHGEIISITDDYAVVRTMRDLYFDGSTSHRTEEIEVPLDYFAKSIEDRAIEHKDFIDWFCHELIE